MNVVNWFREKFVWERYRSGDMWMTVGDKSAWSMGDKVETLLSNPITFCCYDIISDLVSQFKPLINGEENPNHPVVKLLNNPNPLQSKQDFLREFELFKYAEGWVFQYPVIPSGYKDPSFIYNLRPANISYDKTFPTRLMFDADQQLDIQKKQFKYEEDSQKRLFNVDEIIPFFDIANGITDDFLLKSPSRLGAIERNIRNFNAAMDAKYSGIKKTGRFIVSASKSGKAVTSIPLNANEKKDIERAFSGYGLGNINGDVVATTSQTDVHNLSVALKSIGLDESTVYDAMFMVNVFRVPIDLVVLSLTGSTYENQKQSMVNLVQNVVQNRVDDFCNSWTSFFGLENTPLTGSLDHLNVMQVIEQQRADKALKISSAIRNLTGTNISPEQFLEAMNIDYGQ